MTQRTSRTRGADGDDMAERVFLDICVCVLATYWQIYEPKRARETYCAVRKRRPSPFYPPSWAFGVAWSILYGLMAAALFYTTRADDVPHRLWWLYGINLVLNKAWTPVYFAARRFDVAMIIIVALDALNVWIVAELWDVSRTAAWLWLPYTLWGMYASLLNALSL